MKLHDYNMRRKNLFLLHLLTGVLSPPVTLVVRKLRIFV